MKEYESVSIKLVLFENQQDIITSSGGVVFEDETVYGVMPNWWSNGFGS